VTRITGKRAGGHNEPSRFGVKRKPGAIDTAQPGTPKEILSGPFLSPTLELVYASVKQPPVRRKILTRLTALDPFQFGVESGLDLLGLTFTAGDAADIRTVNAQLAGNTTV
jgi:hypothetical protein